jgi:hypothetical protein
MSNATAAAPAITPDFLALVASFLPPYLAAGLDMDAAIVEAVRDVRDWAADRKARLANDPAYKAAAVAYITEQVWTACQPAAVAK